MEPQKNNSHEGLSDDDIVDHVEGRKPLTSEQKRFRRWIYGLIIAGVTTAAAIGGTTATVIVVETNRAKRAMAEKVEKKFPYKIVLEDKLTEEECMQQGFRFTEEGLILPNGVLLGHGENIESIAMHRNTETNKIFYFMMMRNPKN